MPNGTADHNTSKVAAISQNLVLFSVSSVIFLCLIKLLKICQMIVTLAKIIASFHMTIKHSAVTAFPPFATLAFFSPVKATQASEFMKNKNITLGTPVMSVTIKRIKTKLNSSLDILPNGLTL